MKSSNLLRLLQKAGIKVDRPAKGSHVILTKKDGNRFTFAFHGSDEVSKGLESKIRKWAEI